MRRDTQLARNQSVEFGADRLASDTAEQTRIIEQLATRAGMPKAPPPSSTDWDKIVLAGMEYADLKCEAYMASLVRLNRDKQTLTAQITTLGTATAGIMAAAKSAAKEVALAAIAFGFAGSTIDILGNNVLYELEPSSVRALVTALQAKYRASVPTGYASRPAAMNAIRGYAVLCTPASIEAEVNHAVKNAEPKGEAGSADGRRTPAATNAQVVLDTTYGPDDNSELIRKYVWTDGVVNEAHRRNVEELMRLSKVTISIRGFLSRPEFKEERRQIVDLLQLR
ncbi:hypothetical protein [Massilia sp. DD77]|uniref:hypothetical protein n=1 Tax=Massilia sp. DD77 TaxID=3109349 RepID=UPI002FFF5380